MPETGRWVISGHGNHSAAPAGPNQVFLFFSNQIIHPKISVKWNNEHFLLLMRNILFPPSAICVQAADFLSGIVMLKWVSNFLLLFFFIYRPTDTLIKHNFKSTKPLRCDDAGGLLMIHRHLLVLVLNHAVHVETLCSTKYKDTLTFQLEHFCLDCCLDFA